MKARGLLGSSGVRIGSRSGDRRAPRVKWLWKHNMGGGDGEGHVREGEGGVRAGSAREHGHWMGLVTYKGFSLIECNDANILIFSSTKHRDRNIHRNRTMNSLVTLQQSHCLPDAGVALHLVVEQDLPSRLVGNVSIRQAVALLESDYAVHGSVPCLCICC